MSRDRMVEVSARVNRPSAITPRARVRLNATVAIASQAPLALNDFDGRCANGPAFRSANTCSMIAWPRWVFYASTNGAVWLVNRAW